MEDISVDFWGKLKLASVEKRSISEELAMAKFSLPPKNLVVSPESVSSMRLVSHQECELLIVKLI